MQVALTISLLLTAVIALSSVSAANDTTPPERLARVTVASGSPTACFKVTGEDTCFRPEGNNYIRLDWIDGTAYHTTFTTGFYDAWEAERSLAQMQSDGYNIVRVWVDAGDPLHQAARQFGVGGPMETETPDLYQPYLDNLIDFLVRATRHRQYVILVCDGVPLNQYYMTRFHADQPANVDHVNQYFLSPSAFVAKAEYMQALVRSIACYEDGLLLPTVLSWEIQNEMSATVSFPPFNLTAGTVTPANGQTYDMSHPAERLACYHDNLQLMWAELVTAVKAVDAEALISQSLFTYAAVGRTGTTGLLPLDRPDDRVPPKLPVMASSALSFVDVHLYPGHAQAAADLASSDFQDCDLKEKPFLMGEFGAFKHVYPDITSAAYGMRDHRAEVYGLGFQGSLLWTWDECGQDSLWVGLDSNGAINGQLAPVLRK